tara:strand:- start:230285 stop:231097 length:813 start_codon:yes stop_codon:yes gene_type:complete
VVVLAAAQIKGICIDAYSKEPIPYVNISLKDSDYGTVTNLKGIFSLNGQKIKKTDSLIVSHLNYKTQRVGVQNNGLETIELIPKERMLKEVIVSNKLKAIVEKIVGTKNATKKVTLSFVSDNLGTEVGKLIEVEKNQTFELKKLFFNVARLGFKEATFRINFYQLENQNLINKNNSNTKEIITKVTKEGPVEIDLDDAYLSFKSDFLVTIEWIDYMIDTDIAIDNRKIFIASAKRSGPFIVRPTVNSPWNTVKVKFNFGLGISLLVAGYE